jgi:DNA-binding response OmpR family regulator
MSFAVLQFVSMSAGKFICGVESIKGNTVTQSEISVVYVEDDDRLARLTAHYLSTHGIIVTLVSRGELAIAEVLRVRPDVVLLDVMLPGVSGLEICAQLRKRSDVAIIMLTARTEEADRVMGLEGGADDYVSKPFASRELLARIRAQARRHRGESKPKAERLDIGPISMDIATMEVTVAGRRIALTSNEFAVLRAFAQRPGRVLDREQLLRIVHGTSDESFDRSIDVVISRLRQKIEDDPRNPRWLKTIRGAGYVLTAGPL